MPGLNAHNWKGEWDDYHRWFERVMPGANPQATLDCWNCWNAAPFVYDECVRASL